MWQNYIIEWNDVLMKKRILASLMVFCVIFSVIFSAHALESGVTKFSITPIEPSQKNKFIYINITAPKTVANGRMLVGFYTDGKLSKLTPLDISTTTTFTKKKIDTYYTVKDPAGNYFVDQTPDEIKIFTWDKSTLKPKTICSNVLTDEVKLAANAKVISSLQTVLEATLYIRENELDYEEDYLDGIVDEWDEHIFPILDYVDYCAANAIIEAGGEITTDAAYLLADTSGIKLLTSLYARKQYADEISKIGSLLRQATQREVNKLLSFTDAGVLEKEYYTALDNGLKFLDITLTDYKK